jgi:hypothetical protein
VIRKIVQPGYTVAMIPIFGLSLTRVWLPTGVLLATALQPLAAQNAPATIDLKSLKVDVVDDVIIPIPQEIFASLDKLGDQNWAKHLDKRSAKLDGNRSRTAFVFGLVISEGFIAVQAEDSEEVKRIGRDVLNLSGALGVKGEVEGHALAIIDGANADEWTAVRRELDKTRQTVISKMKDMRDDHLADLVSIGGWLGGTRALASLVADNYSVDASELLHQPDLLDQISGRFAGLPQKAKPGPVFEKVYETLESLKPLMRVNGDGAVLQESVVQIRKLSSELTDSVYGK